MSYTTLDARTVSSRLVSGSAFDLIDVRTPAEYESGHAAGARLVPLDRLDSRTVASLRSPDGRPLYVICKSGGRSRKACEQLVAAGLTNVINVDGGTEAWIKAGLPVEGAARRVLPLDRQTQTAAGLLCLAGVIGGAWVNPWLYLLSAMVGCGLLIAGTTGFCGMGVLLARMPWNQARGSSCGCGSCGTAKDQ